MTQGFWKNLKKPIFVLAPMANVTDAAFRRIFAKYGKPDVIWTEFVSADGLVLAHEEGKKKLLRDLLYSEAERPIVAQFFTSNPENMKKAAALARELGFDGIDINMGCPDKSIEKQGAGAALIKNPKRAREVLRAAIEGAGDLPVSVKTRIGYNKIELETWLPELLAENPAAITIHARTRKEMSKVPAQWEWVKRAVEIRNEMKSETFILGNGDVFDLEDAHKKVEATGADGAMLGRAIFGNPYVFNKEVKMNDLPINDRLTIMLEHTKLFDELLGDIKSFAIMKKHYKAYVNGFSGASELRAELMNTNTYKEVEDRTHYFLKEKGIDIL
ncbi:tRNA-dihydrouridine synthase [Patescibacteria group bacterium]|nr:tRNA-dihydrouridine synthase [Patescibacteria group bacterium]